MMQGSGLLDFSMEISVGSGSGCFISSFGAGLGASGFFVSCASALPDKRSRATIMAGARMSRLCRTCKNGPVTPEQLEAYTNAEYVAFADELVVFRVGEPSP